MNNKELSNYISMSVVISFLINFILTLIVGVKVEKIPNFIIMGTCALLATLIMCISISIQLYKHNKIRIKKIFIICIIYPIISFIIGFFIEFIISELFKVKIWNIPRIIASIYESLIAIVVSSIIGYIMHNNVLKK